MPYVPPSTPDGTPGPIPFVETFTVRRLIEELQHHIDIDPERADYPVEIWPLGERGDRRYLPSVVAATGNEDPEIGGELRVFLAVTRSPRKWR